uniref:Apoptosis, caspase activation inhibitor n=1 Tax=Oncorhynchus tshawytscha TaxID=74940 RepID=A0AAZ3NQL7_ONCTS
ESRMGAGWEPARTDEGNRMDEDEDEGMEVFTKRKLESNWDRYKESEKEEPSDDTPTQRGTDYHVLLESAGDSFTQFRFSEEKEWDIDSLAANQFSAVFVDLPALAQSLQELPLHQRLNLEAELVQVGTDASPPETEPGVQTDASPPQTELVQVGTDASPPQTELVQVGTDASPPQTELVQVGTDASPPQTELVQVGTDASPPLTELVQVGTDASPPQTELVQVGTDASPPQTELVLMQNLFAPLGLVLGVYTSLGV